MDTQSDNNTNATMDVLKMIIPAACRLAAPALLAAAAALVPPAALADRSEVPFKAEIDTYEVLGFDAACPLQPASANPSLPAPLAVNSGTTRGRGNASHMGAVALQAHDCITQVYDAASKTYMFKSSNGTFTLTTAHGDSVKATYDENFLQPTAVPGFYTVAARYAIVPGQGRGRFVNARGSGMLRGTLNIYTGTGEYRTTGTISY